MIYLITVNYHSADLIAVLLASIPTVPACTVVIVNNSTTDRQVQKLAEDWQSFSNAQVVLLEAGKNVGFGAACNLGLTWVHEREPTAIAWLLNPDASLTPGALAAAAQFFQTRPECAIVGTRVQEPDGTVWFAGGEFNPHTGAIVTTDGFAHRHSNRNSTSDSTSDYQECAWVTGCSLMVNLRRWDTCPQFDPAYFLYYEDFDFCRRYAQAGYSVGITDRICVIHAPSSISDRNPRFKLKHSTYSYLLTLERYTNLPTRIGRFLRIGLVALGLSVVRPQQAIGKLDGLLMYLRRICGGQSAG